MNKIRNIYLFANMGFLNQLPKSGGQTSARRVMEGLRQSGFKVIPIRRHRAELEGWLAPVDKYKYKDFIKYTFNETDKWENVYPNIIPGWDRSPRSGKKAQIVYGSTPELWKKHCKEALELVKNKEPEHRIIILRSWNEWGEGNYVEPDTRWGHAYLDALHDILFEK